MNYIKTFNDRQKRGIDQVGYDFLQAKKETISHCDLCGGDKFTIIAHHDRYHFLTKTMLCECGNVFLSPRLSAESATELYRGTYRRLISAWHGRDIGAESVQQDQKLYSAEMISVFESLPSLDKSKISSVLDVGGSTGTVLKEIESWIGKSCTLVNIDPSHQESLLSNQKEITTLSGFIEDVDTIQRFDLVVMTWAIDHLRSVSAGLAKIHHVMKDDGYFWMDVMDFRKQIIKKGSVEGAAKIDHNFYFTESVIEEYLAQAGFGIKLKSVSSDKWHVGYLCTKTVPRTIDLELLRQEKSRFYQFTRSLNEPILDDRYQ
jgi:SAM-dependent methyltransferase